MPEKEIRETVEITSSDVARLDITENDAVRLDTAERVTPVPPDERTDREKAIDERLQAIEGDIAKLREEQKSLVRERDEFATARSAQKKLAQLSPAERKALKIPEPQIVEGAGGIPSGEAIGDVGGSAGPV